MKEWESRFDYSPHERLSDVYGEDIGYMYNALNSDDMKGILINAMFHRSLDIPAFIESHQMLYTGIKLYPVLIPTPNLIIPSYLPIMNQALMHDLVRVPLKPYRWLHEIDKAIKLCPPGSYITVKNISGQYKRGLYSNLNRRTDIIKSGRKYVKIKEEKPFSFWH